MSFNFSNFATSLLTKYIKMMKTIKLLLAFLMCSGFAVAQKVVYTSEKPNVKIALPNSGGDGRAVVLCPGWWLQPFVKR